MFSSLSPPLTLADFHEPHPEYEPWYPLAHALLHADEDEDEDEDEDDDGDVFCDGAFYDDDDDDDDGDGDGDDDGD
eukprot:2385141-Rhodomonas_salina.1